MAAVASYIKPSVSTGWTISSHPYTMVIEDTLLALYGPYQLCTQAMYRIKLHSLVGNCESRNVGMRNGMRNGTRNGTRKGSKMRSVPEIRCKVRHDERTCAHCEGVHCEGVHGKRRPPSLLVSSLVCKFRRNSHVCSSVCQFRMLKNGQV